MVDYSLKSDFVKELDKDIMNLIETGYKRDVNESEFNDLALREFELQYNTNKPYRKYCEKRNVAPKDISSWGGIPAIPTDAFKYADLACFPIEQAEKTFISSGTTNPEKRGKYYVDKDGLEIYNKAVLVTTKEYLFPDIEKIKILALSPPPQALPNMGMANGIGLWMREYGTEGSKFLIGREGLDTKTFFESLKEAEKTNESVAIIGASFGFVHLFDNYEQRGLTFNLPNRSRVLDGGGYKGKSREVPKEEFFSKFPKIFGLPEEYCVNLLAMTEGASQYFDNVLRNKLRGVSEPRYKPNHPWTRTIAVDPESLERLPKGEKGILRYYDLANRSTVLAVQTDDIGYEIGNGFEILGRAVGAEPRGCSMAIEELIEATKSGE